MNRIVLVGGEKGGVGKSMVAKALADYWLEREVPCVLFDSDRSNPDLYRTFKDVGCQLVVFSEGRRYQDSANPIVNAAIEKNVLVNLPAQCFPSLKQWFEMNALFELAAECGFEFWHIFVTDGAVDSINLMQRTLKYFRDQVRHVIVKNEGLAKFAESGTAWTALEDESLKTLIAEVQAKVISLPQFHGDAELNTIDQKSLTFRKALGSKHFGLISRKRVYRFLQTSYAAFDAAGLY